MLLLERQDTILLPTHVGRKIYTKLQNWYQYYFTIPPHILPDIIPIYYPYLKPSDLTRYITYTPPSYRSTRFLFWNPVFNPIIPSRKHPEETLSDYPSIPPHTDTRMASSLFRKFPPCLDISHVPPYEYEPTFEPNRHLKSVCPISSPLFQVKTTYLPRGASVIPPGPFPTSVPSPTSSFTPILAPHNLPTSSPPLETLTLHYDET